MSTRERWIVYPLLFLTLGIALKDKITRLVVTRVVETNAVVCKELVVTDRQGRPQGSLVAANGAPVWLSRDAPARRSQPAPRIDADDKSAPNALPWEDMPLEPKRERRQRELPSQPLSDATGRVVADTHGRVEARAYCAVAVASVAAGFGDSLGVLEARGPKRRVR